MTGAPLPRVTPSSDLDTTTLAALAAHVAGAGTFVQALPELRDPRPHLGGAGVHRHRLHRSAQPIVIEDLDLLRPIYAKTAAYGHFGRELPEFTWERTDRAEALRKAAGVTD